MKRCPYCGELNEIDFVSCCSCGNDFESNNYKPDSSDTNILKNVFNVWVDPPVKLTTAPTLEGYRVIESLEIITAECAFGMNIFKDFFTGMTDIMGGRSETTQSVLRNARKKCLSELKSEAYNLGANAVIAVSLAYSEFSGKGKSMLFLVASGTAVKVEKY